MPEAANTSPSNRPISIKFQKVGGVQQSIEAEALIIACEPSSLQEAMVFSAQEQEVFSRFRSYTFHTTLVEVDVPQGGAPYGIVLKPHAIDELSGAVCGYRNETAKTYSLVEANKMEKNLVTIYQLRDGKDMPWTSVEFLAELRTVLPSLDWWPYGKSFTWNAGGAQFQSQLTTRYFDHFDGDGLSAELPWKYLKLQGENSTFYVHASTCFESVLQCYQYIDVLFRAQRGKLPDAKDAPIAILGAGVSGLLAAQSLKAKHGYTNVALYEIDNRFGGKTVTIAEPAPKPSPNAPDTACELGTCYLSPAYDDMVCDLLPFFEGNARLGFRRQPKGERQDGKSFRGIVTKEQFKHPENYPAVMEYKAFAMYKGLQDAGLPITGNLQKDEEAYVEAALAALKTYRSLHVSLMGTSLPMPETPPHKLISGSESGSFYAFLERHDLLVLTGLLEYAYSVQGYGPLHKIPAYYGLVWISVPMVDAIIESFAAPSDKPLVTYLEKGWLQVWRNMAADLKIHIGMIATQINRQS